MMMALRNEATDAPLLINSGASDHMINRPECLFDAQKISLKPISHGNGYVIYATHSGKIVMEFLFTAIGPSHASIAEVKYVLLVPDLNANLVSVPVLTRNGYKETLVGKNVL